MFLQFAVTPNDTYIYIDHPIELTINILFNSLIPLILEANNLVLCFNFIKTFNPEEAIINR